MPPLKVHLLDVGRDQYGDAILCQVGDKTVLIDGAHPGDDDGSPGHESIPAQLGTLLNQSPPIRISPPIEQNRRLQRALNGILPESVCISRGPCRVGLRVGSRV